MKIKTDAGNRAKRTFWQGMGVAVVLGVAGVTAQLVGAWTHSDVLDGAAWVVLGTSVIQAGLTAAASYAQRHIETIHQIKAYEPPSLSDEPIWQGWPHMPDSSVWSDADINSAYNDTDSIHTFDEMDVPTKRGKHE